MYEQYELYHWGIKGQKWGVRRFQNKDGSLTAQGKKRYSDDQTSKDNKSTKVSKYDKYYSDYKMIGYDDTKAKQAAAGKVRTERALKIIGGVAVSAALAYGAYRFYDNHADRIIKPGQAMQTVHMGDAKERLKEGNPFYATYTKRDNTIYASKVFSHFKDSSNVTKFYTQDGIKVASESTSKKTLKELMKNDPEVADYMEKISKIRGKKKGWEQFGYSLVLRNDSEATKTMGLDGIDHDGIHKKFYDALRSKGYGGLIDTNDSKSEGFTWNPVIVFDNQKKYIVSSTKATAEQLGAKQTTKALGYAMARKTALKPIDVKDPNVTGGILYLSALGISATSANRQLNRKVQYVEQYLKDHPNTKMTNTQIAAMYERQKYN